MNILTLDYYSPKKIVSILILPSIIDKLKQI